MNANVWDFFCATRYKFVMHQTLFYLLNTCSGSSGAQLSFTFAFGGPSPLSAEHGVFSC